MGLKISQLPDKAAEDGMMVPASVGGMTYRLLVGMAGGLAKFLHKHEIADVTGLAAQLAEKAPAGYGLGENPVHVADANNAIQNGWYAINSGTLNLPDPADIWNYSYLCVDVGARPDVFIVQTVCTHYKSWRGCKVQRVRVGGVWQPWEWVNPPMEAGVEYRTTERYNGKPVYFKLVNCGNLPENGLKNIAHGIANCKPLQVYGAMSNTNTIPYATATTFSISADGMYIQIYVTGNLSSQTVVATLKYMKTTD